MSKRNSRAEKAKRREERSRRRLDPTSQRSTQFRFITLPSGELRKVYIPADVDINTTDEDTDTDDDWAADPE